ncbi:hypothetical protein D9M68_852170 [compost metagenome]
MGEDFDGEQAAIRTDRQQQLDRPLVPFRGGGQQHGHRGPFAGGQPGLGRIAQQLAGRQGDRVGQGMVVVAAGGQQIEQGAFGGDLASGLDALAQQAVGRDQHGQAEARQQEQDRQAAALHGCVSWPRGA